MNKTLTEGKLFIVTIDKITATGYFRPGKHLLRVDERMKQGNRSWNLFTRCSLYVPLGSDEKGYPIEHEQPGFGIGDHEIEETVPVKEYIAKNNAGEDIRWCRISSAQVAELYPSWVLKKQYDFVEREILGTPPKTTKKISQPKRRGRPPKNIKSPII